MESNWRASIFWWVYAKLYDQLWDNEHLASVGAAINAILPARARVLDVGAGTGIVSHHLVEAGHQVVGCEPAIPMAQRFARRLPDVPLTRVRLEDLGVAVGEFVVVVNVLHMLDDPAEGLACLRRACAPGGLVIVVSPDPDASIIGVAAAQRRAGVARLRVARFVAWHVLLAPLTVLCGMSASRRLPYVDVVSRAQANGEVRRVAGIYRLFVLPPSSCPTREHTG